ncbi:MAG: glycosyltransferase [Acidimicrobiales bacterium]
MLSTFPPTECGIATFAAALAAGIIAAGGTVDVVRCGAAPMIEDASVVASLEGLSPHHTGRAAAALNRTDVAIVQHEYGIYAGDDGHSVLDVINRLTVPVILVAHTVLAAPSASQRAILMKACFAADAVVVMTEIARRRLIENLGVVPGKVQVIAHGAATPSMAQHRQQRPATTKPSLLTWGLLGPGKGIEWAIDAMALLEDVQPRPHYLIAGATHPKVLERSGESYREMLQQRVADSAAAGYVSFDDTYRDLPSLNTLIRSADLVVLPYDSKDQVTSGVLVDAVAAGRPVVSTAFPHAVELLGSGAGIVVPQRDPGALAAAIRSVLTDDSRAGAMAAEARRLAPDLSWTAVAEQYTALAHTLLTVRASMADS